MPLFSTPQSELPRDRWGRPLITPESGGEPVAYTRATTFAGTLDDTTMLTKWKMRMVAIGIAQAQDLRLGALAADPQDRSGKRTLDEIADKAIERANGSVAATTGTALHSFTEKIDRGEDLGFCPEEYLPDLEAYRRVMSQNLIEPVAIEGFCVFDPLQIGGTYDRILRLDPMLVAPDGSQPGAEGFDVIGDVKTGGIDFAMGKIAIQLTTYAHSVDYDHATGARRPLGGFNLVPGMEVRPVSQRWGIVIHLPAGTGSASLHWVDLATARQALDLAEQVRAYRKVSRDLSTRFAAASVAPAAPLSIPEELHAAPDYAALKAVYGRHKDAWNEGLSNLAREIAKNKGWA